MAWLSGWSNRKSITLSRASGAVTNYQMKLLVGESSGATGEDVDCGGLCAADFDDLRFTAADGTTLLDYYIESVSGATPNQLATIWVEFDSIGKEATTFYMYYGKSDAEAVSSGVNTFQFFEDFNALNTADLNGQNGWTAHANFDVATTTKYEGAKAVTTAAGGATVQADHALSGTWNIWAQVRVRTSSVATAAVASFYLMETAGANTGWGLGSSKFQNLYASAWEDSGAGAAANDTWYKLRVAVDAKTTHKIWKDDSLITPAHSSNLNTIVTTVNKIRLEHYSAGGNDFFDQIMVGQYLATEPAWGSWGSQEDFTLTVDVGVAALSIKAWGVTSEGIAIVSLGVAGLVFEAFGITSNRFHITMGNPRITGRKPRATVSAIRPSFNISGATKPGAGMSASSPSFTLAPAKKPRATISMEGD